MLVIGIDVGTTGVKAIVVNEAGTILGTGYKSYPLITKSGSIVEQDATVWYESACFAVQHATKDIKVNQVSALSMSTQGASSLLVDKDFTPLTNAITWMDGRAFREKEEIIANLGDKYVYQKTGWRTHHSLDACKLLWIHRNLRAVYDKADCFISTLEYMNYRMVGVNAIDPTNSSIRQLMDIKTLKYDERILKQVKVDVSKLAKIYPTGECLGCLTKQAAKDFGLTSKVKVYNGAHDQYCGLYGANIVNDGEMMLSTGTAWVTVGVSNQPLYTDSNISPGPHLVKGLYGALASIPGAGAALDWLKGNIIKEDYQSINTNTVKRMEKCKSLLFYPYLSGAAFPVWDDNVKAAFLGLGLEHDRFDLALACMEGVVFQFINVLKEYPKVRKLSVMGGAIQSTIWMDILSSVCKCDLNIMSEKDTPCIGAALIAAVGEGLDYSLLVNRLNKSTKYMPPDKKQCDHYKHKYEKYKEMSEVVFRYRTISE